MILSAEHAAPGGFFVIQSEEQQWVDEWLRLVDKLTKGHGYFKLQMFADAAEHLEEALRIVPDLHEARLLLATARMRMSEYIEARRHYQVVALLADHPKWQAVAYNGLGCIQAAQSQLEQARSCFRRALEADPTCADARKNLEMCQSGRKELRLRFWAGELEARGRSLNESAPAGTPNA